MLTKEQQASLDRVEKDITDISKIVENDKNANMQLKTMSSTMTTLAGLISYYRKDLYPASVPDDLEEAKEIEELDELILNQTQELKNNLTLFSQTFPQEAPEVCEDASKELDSVLKLQH